MVNVTDSQPLVLLVIAGVVYLACVIAVLVAALRLTRWITLRSGGDGGALGSIS